MTGSALTNGTTSPLIGGASQWWALSDLNGRPFGCKPNALTAELSAHSQIHRTGSGQNRQRASECFCRLWGTLSHVYAACRAGAEDSSGYADGKTSSARA